MISPILHGLLWLSRAAIRSGRLPVHAGHGYADPAYRPPRLPFVSVVGPIAVAADRQRDAAKPREATMQLPGHLIGQARPTPASVPAGALRLRFDGDASVTINVAGGALEPEASARQVASQIEGALRAAGFTGSDGAAITEPARLAELALVTCRWDPGSRRFAVSSGRRGVMDGLRRSSVEVLAVAGGVAGALGLEGGQSVEGRLKRHTLPPPRAMTVDVRLELWAASQSELAAMADDLARAVEVRTSFATRPALLAADARPGDATIKLLPQAEPVTPASMVMLEAADGPADRVSNRSFEVPQNALGGSPPAFLITGANQMRLPVNPTPLVPSPLDAGHPAPRGVALSIGVAVAPGATNGQHLELCALQAGGKPVLRLELTFVRSNNRLFGEVTATATFVAGGVESEASTSWRLPVNGGTPPERPFERGVTIHAAVVGATGTVELWVDGQARPPDATPAPVLGQGLPIGGQDMVLTVGSSGGNPLGLSVRHLHLFSEPLGAFDPGLRRSLANGRHFMAGQRLRLARTEDGFSPGKDRAETTVVAVEGDTLTVFPLVEETWPRGRTLVFADELFLQQIELRRRDDLLNQVYRFTGDYRIAALIESDFAETSAPLVEIPEVDVRARHAGRGGIGVPGVKVVA